MIQRYSDGLSSSCWPTPDKPVRHVCRGQLANVPERATNDYTGREVADIGEALKTNYLLIHADALQVKAYSNGGS